ncbi:MAG TPA: redoxin domain-containing protein [Thermoanaerobaculia bacterium]|nr:redoxin domain-containing protein [Thermoanaerobaculia bacterium]
MIKKGSPIRWIVMTVLGALLALPLLAGQGEPKTAQDWLKASQTAAFQTKDYKTALSDVEKAGAMAPRDLEVQEEFISLHRYITLVSMSHDEAWSQFLKLRKRYEKEARREPKNALWQVLLGDVQFYENPKASRKAYERALELDPKQTTAMRMLGIIAETKGDNALSQSYFKRAAATNPDDPKLASGYVGSLMDTDPEAFFAAAKDFIRRFPGSPQALEWYYWMGEKAGGDKGREIWKEAIDRYPIAKTSKEQMNWLSNCYDAYFESLQQDDPQAAEQFARSTMQTFHADASQRKAWFERYRRQALLNLAVSARESGEPQQGLSMLDLVGKGHQRIDPLAETVAYERAMDQAATGATHDALDTLLKLLKDHPNPVAEAAYYSVAAKAGQSQDEAQKALWKSRMADAKPMKDFALKDVNGKTVRLSDYRGKIVLVNFWYPSCGPCRGEFPHLERVVEHFSGKPFVVLSLNTHPKEAYKVAGFMHRNDYHFTALQTPGEEWCKKNYGVIGTPSNFLLDGEGRIVAEPRLYDTRLETQLEQQIGELLARMNSGDGR